MAGSMRKALGAWLVLVIVFTRACALRDEWPVDPCATVTSKPESEPDAESGDQAASDNAVGIELKMALLSGHRGVKLIISGSFQGFLIQARRSDDSGSLVLGHFTPGSDGGAKTYPCKGKKYAVILHKDYSTKTRTAVVWRPPRNFSGKIVFRTSVTRKNGENPKNIVSIPVNVEKGKAFIWSRSVRRSSRTPRARVVAQASKPAGATDATDLPGNGEGAGKALDIDDPSGGGAAGGKNIYQDCGVATGCFGYPSGCIATADCLMLVSYQLQDDGYHFDLVSGQMTKDQFWIGAGVSDTDKMDATHVVECLKMSDGTVVIQESYNVGTSNEALPKPTDGITYSKHEVTDGVLKCSWVRQAVTTVKDKTFDFKNKYFVILATGGIAGTAKLYHGADKGASSEPLSMGEKRLAIAASERNPLILVHGNLMLLGWLYLVGLAIMIARHFKPVWEGSLILGDKVWFFLHRGLMVTAMTSVLVSVGVIFYTTGGWSYSGNPHPILGLTAVVLGCFQPIMALFRCHPEEPNRYIFNWMHWANGNVAQCFAVATICFASGLAKSYLEKSTWFLPTVAMFVVFYIFVHVALQAHRSLAKGAAAAAAPAASPLGEVLSPKQDAGAAGPPSQPAGQPPDAAAPPAEVVASPPPPTGIATAGGPLPPELGAAGIQQQEERKTGAPAAAAQPQEGADTFPVALLALYAVVSLVIVGFLCGMVCTAPPKT